MILLVKKLRKCKYIFLYIGVYLSVCILMGGKYIFTVTVTVTFTTYIPVYIDGIVRYFI